MSYIPDYRDEKNITFLNKEDKILLRGYSVAIEDAVKILENAFEDGEISQNAKENCVTLLECSEIEAYCSIFENADYIPDDVELKDANKDLYKNISTRKTT